MCLLLGMAQPGRLARLLAAPHALGGGPALENRNWKLESGDLKLETRNWKFETGANLQSKIGNLYSGQAQGRWTEEKNFTNEATKLLKTNDSRTN
jgi:hypothetical protein